MENDDPQTRHKITRATDVVEDGVREGMDAAEAGRTIAYKDIRRWLASWGTANELPPPRLR